MHAPSPRPALRLLPLAWLVAVFLLAQAAGGCSFSASPAASPSPSPPAPAAGKAAPGLFDDRLDPGDLDGGDTAAWVREDTKDLHAAWIRLDVLWSEFEPAAGSYDTARLARLDQVVDQIHAAGADILLTVRNVPEWASDASYWTDPPPGVPAGYKPNYPMTQAALPRLGDFAESLARRYGSKVQGLECWNEPNLWLFLYPQRKKADPDFAARTYLKMLAAFSAGVRRAGTKVRVVAGATASFGNDNVYGTSPQRFAGYLAGHGAAPLFDVYSHHAYTPGANAHHAPGDVPDRPETTVTLGNLDELLYLFPAKPFYISEFGYSTRPSIAFGWFFVSERTQARYLKRAYAVAARYPRVELLVWYLVVDQAPPGQPADTGVYTGLRRADGTRKPSWYAYARVGAAAE